jgi:hypothetical protein
VPGGAATGYPGHQLSSRRRGFAPAGGHAEHGLGGQIVAQVLHDRERVRVGPVQVFEHQQQAGAPGEPPQQLQHGLAAHRCRVVTAAVTFRTADRGNHRPQRGQPRRQAGVVGKHALAQRLQQRLCHRPVRDAGAGGYGTAGKHRRPARPRLGGQFASQPGLADPRLAGEEHHRARAVPGCRERGPQPRGLRIAADEHGTQQVRHQIIMLRGTVGGRSGRTATVNSPGP